MQMSFAGSSEGVGIVWHVVSGTGDADMVSVVETEKQALTDLERCYSIAWSCYGESGGYTDR